MYRNNINPDFIRVLHGVPHAWAKIKASASYPQITGNIRFYGTIYGVVAVAEISGLRQATSNCDNPVFGFHIHEGSSCGGNGEEPFPNTSTHYNPNSCPHPYHAGDLPPLFGAGGYAFSAFLTNRFTIPEIIGKTIIIHSSPDDFTTQPSGNSGTKIACGEIMAVRR